MTGNKCTGCRYCEIACSLVKNNGIINPQKSVIRVKSDILSGKDYPVVCLQCDKEYCKTSCPHEALIKNSLGILTVNEELCDGCMKCAEACPFHAIYFDEDRHAAAKCDLCGGDPECVKFCEGLYKIGGPALKYKG